jgi:hypothetical protein
MTSELVISVRPCIPAWEALWLISKVSWSWNCLLFPSRAPRLRLNQVHDCVQITWPLWASVFLFLNEVFLAHWVVMVVMKYKQVCS